MATNETHSRHARPRGDVAGTANAGPPLAGAVDEARRIARETQRTHGPDITAVTTTSGVAALELFNPATGWSHSVPAGNGIHFTLCGRCPPPLRSPGTGRP